MTDVKPHLPTRMPTDNRPQNDGCSLNDLTSRLDAVAKVTGRARYSRDMYLPGMLFVGLIRCPFGAGELRSSDEQAALAVPGVLEVNLRTDEGRYHGHPVGHLVAESEVAMRRGLHALQPQWFRESVTTMIEDHVEGPPAIPGAAQEVLDKASQVLEATYTTQVQTHSALETHGSVVDHRGDSATVYTSTQGTFSARDGLSDELGLPDSNFDLICEYVGGGFGAKLRAGKESMTAARVAAKYKRPVRLFCDREEEHLDTGNRPSSRTVVRIGFDDDGTVRGGQIHVWGGVGVGGGGGAGIPSGNYDLGAIRRSQEDIKFNAGAPRPFRAPGRPQGAFAEELMLDEIATRIDLDPVALRSKLETDEDRREMLTLGATRIGWSQRRPTGSQRGLVRRGFGVGAASWGRFPAAADAEVVINRDGSVEARTGTQDIGTGNRTVMGVVTAHVLGVPLRAVRVRLGNSSLPAGPASGGSMTVHNTEPAMTRAAEDARSKLLTMVADHDGGDASEYTIVSGEVRRAGTPHLTWEQACRRIGGDSIVGRGRWDMASRAADPSTGHSNGVQFVDLDVDTETGVVRVRRIVAIQACGRVVVRKTAEHQIIGGVIQGISYALFENRVLDPRVGSMLNANFDMYKILGSVDMPHIEPVLWTKNQTGTRSLGEPPTIPTAGAIACAIYNAVGAPVRSLPMTPDRVLAALEGGAA